jgi:hypothetical protein
MFATFLHLKLTPFFFCLGLVWLSSDLLLTTHKRTSAIVQHDISQSRAKYADELPSQALGVSKKGSLCFGLGGNNKDSRSHIEEELSFSSHLSSLIFYRLKRLRASFSGTGLDLSCSTRSMKSNLPRNLNISH